MLWYLRDSRTGYAKLKPIFVYRENQSAIYFPRKNKDNSKTKHTDIIYHFAREQLVTGL